jgi:hypothetical protein
MPEGKLNGLPSCRLLLGLNLSTSRDILRSNDIRELLNESPDETQLVDRLLNRHLGSEDLVAAVHVPTTSVSSTSPVSKQTGE